MIKSYRVDGSFGEITNKLEDKIQSGQGVRLREVSFEYLSNFIPDSFILLKSINGVSLESAIIKEQCKVFNVILQEENALIFIFQNKIITFFTERNKYFVNAIDDKIQIDINSLSTCFLIKNSFDIEQIVFNSLNGIYFATSKSLYISDITEGSGYFETIEIPTQLTGQEINSIEADVYLCATPTEDINDSSKKLPIYIVGKNFLNDKIISPSQLPYDGLSFLNNGKMYINNKNIKINDTISFDFIYPYNDILLNKIIITIKDTKIINTVKGWYWVYNGIKQFYPLEKKPTIEDLNNLKNPYGISKFNSPILIPDNAELVTFLEIEIDTKNIFDKIVDINFLQNIFSVGDLVKYSGIIGTNIVGSDFEGYAHIYYVSYLMCIPNINIKINITSSSKPIFSNNNIPIFNPFSIGNRLVVSIGNTIKLSAVGNYSDFLIPETPKDDTPFSRTLQGVRKIKWVFKWGQAGVEEGISIGTENEIIFFSSIASIFDTSIIARIGIPCSEIKPIEIIVNNFPAILLVERGRKKITGVIFSRNQINEIPLTDKVDFFDNDPIIKLEQLRYGTNLLIFALTENKKLYACLTGKEILAWFRINLTYKIEDLTVIDTELNNIETKKLFLLSNLQNDSSLNIIGSIDFSENANRVRAEYYYNLSDDKYIFSDEIPTLISDVGDVFLKKENIPFDFKQKVAKPIISKFIFHNQEIISSKVNTKASKTNRSISDLVLNVRNSNFFKVEYNCKETDYGYTNIFEQNVYEVNRIDGNFKPKRIKEVINIFQDSPAVQSVAVSLETNKNTIAPLDIQSISFNTKYGNI